MAQVQVMNGKILNKRTLKVTIASDNGRAREFIKRKACIHTHIPVNINIT